MGRINSTYWSRLLAVFLLVGSPLQAQTQSDYHSSDSIQNAKSSLDASLKRVLEQKLPSGDGTALDTIVSLRLLLEFDPKDRRRFVVPRPLESSKNSAEKVKKLLETSEVFSEFQGSWETLLDGLEQAVELAEKNGDRADAYRLRWHLAGLQSILPASPASKKVRKSASWPQSDSLKLSPDVKKSYVNHPKTLWPAGSFSIATTPHFEIAFQSDPKAAAEVAVLSEQSYAIWKQIFFPYWAVEQTVAPEYREDFHSKFSVVLFRDKASYAKALRAIPDISVSTGYYDPNQKLALFYWDGNKTPSTVVHELTHQFFYETSSKQVALDTNRGAGFWVVEGAALYIESLSTRVLGGSLVVDVGGWDSPRLQAGRYRRLHDKYWVPWDEFHSADGNRLRGEEDIRAWYSQAAGLAHLWLDGDKPRQQDFFEYLDSVYANAENPALLGEWNDDKTLRDIYDRYLIAGPSSAPTRPFFANRREAVLSRSRLTSEQLLAWPVELRTTPWLDLSFSQVGDGLFVVGGKNVAPIWNVQRLNLESSKVTDSSMTAIAEGKNLYELDLSMCTITDAGLAAFKEHKSLKTLWLNQCPVTDKSIDILLSIPHLEAVHVSNTAISPKGWERLLAAKPRLKMKSTAP